MQIPFTYQLPLRLRPKLAEELDSVSKATGISRSDLCRMGITGILQDFRKVGVASEMTKFRDRYSDAESNT